ncbi:hypothetical protein GCM10010211_81450 [Streptomyces albospinus]|uniref:Transposase n=1 Tax=Streptomyces albospinus TaxID=285515 RepID=A0ABQ2VNF0_9ACTN|nr:hypothetical protein [Streptomyces albospinus]GGV01864.1 hypothetical protein GCM10010211_81450 [Streptomyces albospinus]
MSRSATSKPSRSGKEATWAEVKEARTACDGWICFEDEAGFTRRLPKGRTWGRRGIGAHGRGPRGLDGSLGASKDVVVNGERLKVGGGTAGAAAGVGQGQVSHADEVEAEVVHGGLPQRCAAREGDEPCEVAAGIGATGSSAPSRSNPARCAASTASVPKAGMSGKGAGGG